jgi:hypothetical protein
VVLLALTASLIALSGCATITRGTHEALVVESEPSGAQVRLSNGFTGTTPTSFKIPRKGEFVVTISKEGYETANINVTTQIAGAGAAGMAGNVLVGGIIGAGVDAWSGGMLEHKPNPVKVTLVQLRSVAPAAVVPQPMPTFVTTPAPSSTTQVGEHASTPAVVTSPPPQVVAAPIQPEAPAKSTGVDAPKAPPAAETSDAPKPPLGDAADPNVIKPGV